MDFVTIMLPLSVILSIFFIVLRSNSSSRRLRKLPPGPFPIPIIGNILQLGRNPHQSLAKLSKTYGPLMHLKLGNIRTIIISSPQMAKEILQKHDRLCSGRTVPSVAQTMDHHKASVAWLSTGPKWRKFRRVCEEAAFNKHKLEESEDLRQEKLQQLSDYLKECCLSARAVDIGEVAFITSLNMMSVTLLSFDFVQFSSNSVQELKELIERVVKISGVPNLADYFPVLKLIDVQRLKREMDFCFGKLSDVFDEIISKRLKSREVCSDYSRKKDFLDMLLDRNQENESSGLTRNDIKNLLMDILLGGVDTVTVTVEWAMAELLRNPKEMLKAKDELRTVIGENKRVKESDIPKLSYLNAVVKETFRYHPAGPLLVPHKAEVDVEINGYIIPKDAQILVNAWGIGRDPSIWTNPYSFEPERFLDNKIDYKGHDFELIPFGSGRRICLGMPLAHLMIHLMVATFIHEFDWKLENEDVDMNEIFGLSLHKAVPLKAIPIE